ncbi:MAG: DNA cytosine methyltransferase [Candidatus Taylorbacteria bacterium CG11_big_fil_rev_8_21_14_0_20_46_11]|uniref:DNA (cytosine-5-)-methyltransferase n=1 Tax=Candidatus Taylorbacteria bacterium CG11_big_fil_rev_8_21_14_0_20_46_11 TaxID=1975025 RepID=A0A2H0KBB9_9BACT|nr:MAG: DNA cytosine methyltransferase [Candidatus Taylorbacteria bacterium CG11_big_fil_rev_8_21_14_0_20_46_11]
MSHAVLDLFSGVGGFSLGLERAGMNTVAFCEQDETCQKVLKKHWPKTPIFSDVKTLTKHMLTSKGISKIDIITAGFPCQDVSELNTKGKGLKGEKSGLWIEAKRLIRELKPKYAIIENVANIRSRGLAQILKDLWQIGYDCEWHILPASIFDSCPHERERVWILAYPCSTRLDFGKSNGPTSKTATIIDRYFSMLLFQSGAAGLEKGKEAASHKDQTDEKILSQALCQNERSRHRNDHLERFNAHWTIESSVRRMVNGLPKKLVQANNQRIKQLGNSVVPQIPELIGRAILDDENTFSI